jgi:hypothetical protein
VEINNSGCYSTGKWRGARVRWHFCHLVTLSS